MTWYNHPFVQATLIGVLLGIGFVIPPLWPAGLLGVAWLFLLLVQVGSTCKQILWMWFVKSLVLSSWVWAVYPIDWLGFELGWIELPMIGLYWVTVSASLALGGIGLYVGTKLCVRYVSKQYVYLGFPILWLLAELASSLAFSLFLYGSGGSIGITFSMGYVGYLFGEHGLLIQLASIYGVYGLSLLYVTLAVIGVALYRTLYMKTLFIGVACLLLTSVLHVPANTTVREQITITVVDTTLPTEIDQAMLQVINTEILQAAKSTDSDYIIFPEDSRVFDQSTTPQVTRAVLAFTQSDTQAVLIDSGRVDQQSGSYLQAAIYDGTEKKLYQSQKRYLVPQGEYLPYIYSWLFRLVGQGNTATVLDNRLAYRVGTDTSQSHFGARIPAILFCFEVVDPKGVRRAIQERTTKAPFVAHILSHAWINHSPIFQKQLETMLRVQAIWNDIYIVSAANHATGYTVTASGVVLYPEQQAEGEYWTVGTIQIPQ